MKQNLVVRLEHWPPIEQWSEASAKFFIFFINHYQNSGSTSHSLVRRTPLLRLLTHYFRNQSKGGYGLFSSPKREEEEQGLISPDQPLIIELRRDDILEDLGGKSFGPRFLFPLYPKPTRTLESHQFCHEVRNLIQLSIR